MYRQSGDSQTIKLVGQGGYTCFHCKSMFDFSFQKFKLFSKIPEIAEASTTVDKAVEAVPWESVAQTLPIESLVETGILNQPLLLTGQKFETIYEALSSMDLMLPVWAKYCTLLGPFIDTLNTIGLSYPLSIITVCALIRVAGSTYRIKTQQKNANFTLIRGKGLLLFITIWRNFISLLILYLRKIRN